MQHKAPAALEGRKPAGARAIGLSALLATMSPAVRSRTGTFLLPAEHALLQTERFDQIQTVSDDRVPMVNSDRNEIRN